MEFITIITDGETTEYAVAEFDRSRVRVITAAEAMAARSEGTPFVTGRDNGPFAIEAFEQVAA